MSEIEKEKQNIKISNTTITLFVLTCILGVLIISLEGYNKDKTLLESLIENNPISWLPPIFMLTFLIFIINLIGDLIDNKVIDKKEGFE